MKNRLNQINKSFIKDFQACIESMLLIALKFCDETNIN